MQDDYDLIHSRGQEGAPAPSVPPPPPTPPQPPYPFIEPQLTDAAASNFPLRRIIIAVAALVVLLGGVSGVIAVIRSTGSADRVATERGLDEDDSSPGASDEVGGSSEEITDEDTETYEGDGSDITEVRSPTVTWHCPDSATDVSGEGGDITCAKVSYKTAAPTVVATCPAGYSKYVGSTTSCRKSIGGSTKKVAARASYGCPSGYKKSGSGASTKCAKTVTKSVLTTYRCPSGYSQSGSGANTRCSRATVATAAPLSTCPAGYTKYGSGASTGCARSVAPATQKKYSCPSGYAKSGSGANTKCTKTINPKKNGTCKSGYKKSGGKCKRTIKATVTTTYSCPSGYAKSGSGATTTCSRAVSPSYSCPSGYTASGSGASMHCTKVVVTYASPLTSTACPSGYSRSSSSCKKTVSAGHTVAYSCPSGYSRSGNSCSRSVGGTTLTLKPTIRKSCPADYKLSSDGKHCKKQVRVSLKPNKVYSCEDGWEILDTDDKGKQCVETSD